MPTGSIIQTATSVTALIGTAPRLDAPAGPTRVDSLAAFESNFGDRAMPHTHLSRAAQGFFENGGQVAIILARDAAAGPVSITELAPLAAWSEIALVAAPGRTDPASHDALISHCEIVSDRFAVLDTPPTVPDIEALTKAAPTGVRPRQSDGGFAAAYAPWIALPAQDADGTPIPCPPSGHLCGIYARIDATRGVQKPPANAAIRGALGPTRDFTVSEASQLTAAHVNPLLVRPHGFRVWGARTLAASTSEYRYIPVRRLALMLRQSILEGTRWAAREANDPRLWHALRRAVDAFMLAQWRSGAVRGAGPSEAFFVRCDASTTTQADIIARRAIILVGFAPMRPAEFILIRMDVTTA